jgi:hypothetical protein
LAALYSRELIDMEEFLLTFILKWKLIYVTPLDFIQALAYERSEPFKKN